jgi:hypothetical protein
MGVLSRVLSLSDKMSLHWPISVSSRRIYPPPLLRIFSSGTFILFAKVPYYYYMFATVAVEVPQ